MSLAGGQKNARQDRADDEQPFRRFGHRRRHVRIHAHADMLMQIAPEMRAKISRSPLKAG
jgi:hypothetical protein